MDNQDKLATNGTQDEQSKTTTQYGLIYHKQNQTLLCCVFVLCTLCVLETILRKQNTNNVNKT